MSASLQISKLENCLCTFILYWISVNTQSMGGPSAYHVESGKEGYRVCVCGCGPKSNSITGRNFESLFPHIDSTVWLWRKTIIYDFSAKVIFPYILN